MKIWFQLFIFVETLVFIGNLIKFSLPCTEVVVGTLYPKLERRNPVLLLLLLLLCHAQGTPPGF